MSPAKSAKHALSKVEGDAKVKLKKWLGGAFASLACPSSGSGQAWREGISWIRL